MQAILFYAILLLPTLTKVLWNVGDATVRTVTGVEYRISDIYATTSLACLFTMVVYVILAVIGVASRRTEV